MLGLRAAAKLRMGAKLKEYTSREAREEQERSKAQEAELKVQARRQHYQKEEEEFKEYLSKIDSHCPTNLSGDEKPSAALMKWADMAVSLNKDIKSNGTGWQALGGAAGMASLLASYNEKVDRLFLPNSPSNEEESSSSEDEPIPQFMTMIRAKRKLIGKLDVGKLDAHVEVEAARLARQVLAVADLGSDEFIKRALAWCPKELKDKMTVEVFQKRLASLSQVCFNRGGPCACAAILDLATLNYTTHNTGLFPKVLCNTGGTCACVVILGLATLD